jgi:hypothetical protein
MTPSAIFQETRADGVTLALSPSGTIKVIGDVLAVNRWADSIKEHKNALVEILKAEAAEERGIERTGVVEPFDREAFEERAGICEFDGGLTREDAETIAWREDDRRRCAHCLNLLTNGVCKVAALGGPVSVRRGYQPDPVILHRCAGYRPCPDDPDRRTGRERWPSAL